MLDDYLTILGIQSAHESGGDPHIYEETHMLWTYVIIECQFKSIDCAENIRLETKCGLIVN